MSENQTTQKLFDVIATNLKTGQRRIIDKSKTRADTEAIINMCVMRRGVNEEFFSALEQGSYTL